jgi:hypothetical protein
MNDYKQLFKWETGRWGLSDRFGPVLPRDVWAPFADYFHKLRDLITPFKIAD